MTEDDSNGNTLRYRLERIEQLARELDLTVEANGKVTERHEEQINGDRGLSKSLLALSEDLRSLRRAIWVVGAGIVASAVGFCFTVLTVFGGP